MRILIVDDEPLARERLRRLVSELPGYEVVGEAADGEAALAQFEQEEPDVVLMDIRMGGALNGLQISRRLAAEDPPPAVVFTTAYPEHALSAFEANAAGYLVKPIRLDRLRDTLQQIRKLSRAQSAAVTPAAESAPLREHVLATTRDGLLRIPVDEILYFSADQKYTTVHHLHGEHLIEESLRTLERDLAPVFLRVHRKFLVAMRYVTALDHGGPDSNNAWIRLRRISDRLPVSRRRLPEVRRRLGSEGR